MIDAWSSPTIGKEMHPSRQYALIASFGANVLFMLSEGIFIYGGILENYGLMAVAAVLTIFAIVGTLLCIAFVMSSGRYREAQGFEVTAIKVDDQPGKKPL
jgi:hypothetical protein